MHFPCCLRNPAQLPASAASPRAAHPGTVPGISPAGHGLRRGTMFITPVAGPVKVRVHQIARASGSVGRRTAIRLPPARVPTLCHGARRNSGILSCRCVTSATRTEGSRRSKESEEMVKSARGNADTWGVAGRTECIAHLNTPNSQARARTATVICAAPAARRGRAASWAVLQVFITSSTSRMRLPRTCFPWRVAKAFRTFSRRSV